MQVPQKDMDCYFQSQPFDNAGQQSMRQLYLNMFWSIDAHSCDSTGAEKMVAKRKLMESMDAAMRALS